ncbi:hypothetical protein [Paenibacillus donghaensis]|uniref:Uncharacterized protein n=1 Tax=Paenibacillus donghaensis TaxID=414771 RepID=A0A2Z2KHI3_9BACL|nr:hypothetical protein [Paenibacillus donghaensis]ASA22640.1 hypothetical protein B9T62_18710 [Paenibacillus donghaensis]
MTVVIGYIGRDFSILVTDTRMFVNGRKENGVMDDYQKLRNLPYPLGWLTGAGFTRILNNFEVIINNNPAIIGISNFEDIAKDLYSETSVQNPEFLEFINSSNIYTSFFYRDLGSGKLKPTVLYITKDRTINVKEFMYFIDYPYDFRDEMITELVEKYKLNDIHTDTVETALNNIFHIFDEISGNSDGVSKICDVGIHIDTSTELVKKQIRSNINELLK